MNRISMLLCSENTPPLVFNWIWHGELSREQIQQELTDFSRAGIPALCIIPEPKSFRPNALRTYLEPDYMSDEYLEYYRFTVERAEELGMKLWLYDEGGWPSGGACGLTAKILPDCGLTRLRAVKLAVDAKYVPSEKALAAFFEGRRVAPGESFTGELTEYRFERLNPGPNFVDLARIEVTRAFLESTHERYLASLERLDEHFAAVFTDEPSLEPYAWREDLPNLFESRFGYDLLDHLPALFDGSSTDRAKIDYRTLLGEIFDANFVAPYAKWCHEHGVKLIGHFDRDHVLDGSIAGLHGSGLKLLRRLDIPGVDAIWRQIFPGETPVPEGCPFFVRIASSAANQNGSGLALSESFAVYGDDITPDEIRYVINYQLVRGINVINYMNLPYGRKRALPFNMRPMLCPEKPGFFASESLWRLIRRSCTALTKGTRICDTALYLPVADISLEGEAAKRASESFIRLGNKLERAHIDFDIIDDEIILDGSLENGELSFGGARYRHIVMPDCSYAPESVKSRASQLTGRGEPLIETDSDALRVLARELDGMSLYFIFNQSSSRTEASVSLPSEGKKARLDPVSGELSSFDDRLTLESGEAAMLLVGDLPEFRERRFEFLARPTLEPISLRRFIASGDRVSTETVAVSEIPAASVSGELTFRLGCKLEPGNYRLKIVAPGMKLALCEDGEKLGDCAVTPQAIDFDYRGGELTLTVANSPSNEFHAKFPELEKVWDKAEYFSYNGKMMELEQPDRLPLSLPEVEIFVQIAEM